MSNRTKRPKIAVDVVETASETETSTETDTTVKTESKPEPKPVIYKDADVLEKLPKPTPPTYSSPKLGTINGKPILCGHKCAHCPLLTDNKIQIKNIKGPNGKLQNIICKSMAKAV